MRIVAVVIALLLLLCGCESTSTIVHGLNEQAANEILVLLAKEHIAAYKIQEKGGGGPESKAILWDVAVNAQDRVHAMAVLSANGLPRTHAPGLLELFTASGLVPSQKAEEIRYEAGLAGSLAQTIRKIDGVMDADVIVSFPEEDPLNPTAEKKPITATVFVKHAGILDDPNSHIISKIKQLISSSVSGLQYGNVTVIADRARLSSPSRVRAHMAPAHYVEVWGFVLAESSLSRFQSFFFFTTIFMFVLVFAILWLSWKIYPVARKAGDVKLLLSRQPLPDAYGELTSPPETEEKKDEEQKAPEEPKKPPVQENVEE